MVAPIGDSTAEFQGLLNEYAIHPTAALADQLATIAQKLKSIMSVDALNTTSLDTNRRVLSDLMAQFDSLPTVEKVADARDASLRVHMEYWIYVGGVIACVLVACLVGYWSMPSSNQFGVQLGGQRLPSFNATKLYTLGGLAAISLMLVGALSIKSYALLFVWGALVLCHVGMARVAATGLRR